MKRVSLLALWLCATCICAQEATVPAPAAPDYEDCLKQKPALQTLESKLQDGEQILTLADISHRAIIFIEACGGGGGGANARDGYYAGNGGGSMSLVRLLLHCGEPLGAWAGSSRDRKLDCKSKVSVKVPGRSGPGQSGGAAMLLVSGGDGVIISKGGGRGEPSRYDSANKFVSGNGTGYRIGGNGHFDAIDRNVGENTYHLPAVGASAGADTDTFVGGAAGADSGGGGGGASDIGNGGSGGALGQAGGAGGVCAGGGGAGRRNGGGAPPTGGSGGPGYARIVAIDINEVANCGRAALLKNLQFEVSRLVQAELKKAATPPATAPAEAAQK